MTDILVYTEEQGNVIAGSVQPDRMTVAVLGAVGGGTGGGGGAVSSVNGQIGHVVLDAADVGADATGTAASAVSAHEADTTPHDVITQVDKFGFDTAAAQTAGVGELVWNAADGTVDIGLPGGVTLQAGQEQLIRVLNKTGSTIQNMHVVYITGAQGNRITAAQAQANSASADKTLAVATQGIANNAEGFATLQGLVRGVNTSAWAEGTELWLSAAVAGAITNVRPAAPNHQVRVGYVVRSHASEGSIYVTVNIGADLSHLHDVVITAPNDNDVLAYDAATQTWRNEPQTGGSGEINTASNLGAGTGVFASKVAADLQFKSLVAGANVSITSNATTVTISATGGGGGGGGAVDSVNGQTGVVVLDTDDISEGVTNLYFTNARASAAAPVQSVNGQTGAVDLSVSYAPLSHVGSGGTAHANVIAGGAAGFMSGADKTKLDGIAAGAQVNVPTNLTTTTSATTLTVNSDTGTDATLPAATTSVAGVMTAADKTKLDGIAPGATANADTDSLAEGATNKYFTEGRVRSTVLTGLSLLTGGVISAADSMLSALGKLQKQISDAVTAIGGKQDTLVSGTNIKTVNGSSLLGAGDLSISAGAALAQVVEYTGTAKTLALTDINTIVDCTSSSAVTITIPPQSSVAWTPDAEIHVRMSGTGQVSIAGGAGVTAPPLTLPVALSAQGALVTLKRRSADVWAVVGGVAGSGDDLLSMFVNAEVAIAGAVTLTASAFGKMHVCSGTSADYTVTLPPVSGNAGKLIGFRMESGLTKLVTLDGNASELIDGAATRVMWANEVAVLLCNGSSWVKIAGKSVPMVCEMYPTTALSVAHAVNTKVPLESTVKDNSGSMADPVTNKRVNVKRPGIYRVQGIVYYQSGTQTMTANHSRIHINGSLAPLGVNIANLDVAAAKGYFNQHDVELTLAPGDYIELYAYQESASSAARDLYVNSTAFSYLAVVEKTTW